MLNSSDLIAYIKEMASSSKSQIAAVITFGTAICLIWLKEDKLLILFTIFFLYPLCLLLLNLMEKIFTIIANKYRRNKAWNNLTDDEQKFLAFYFINKTKTQYVSCYNGTYTDSGIINPLIKKEILYLASNLSEYRGEHWAAREQQFPINITDDAYVHLAARIKCD